MKKTVKFTLGICLAMLACVLLLAACDGNNSTMGGVGDTTNGDVTLDVETEAVIESQGELHTHIFGEWEITRNSSCNKEGEKKRFCVCGESQTELISMTEHIYGDWLIIQQPTYTLVGQKCATCTSCGYKIYEDIPTKQPQKVKLEKENFENYFDISHSVVYDEYNGGKIFNYGTIDVTLVCGQSVMGDIENVAVTLAVYPRGGRWDDTNFTDEEREINLSIPAKTGVASSIKHMGFATTQPLSAGDVREPDNVDIVIISVTGTITIYP